MTKAREIAELGQKLTVDASGNIDVNGSVTANTVSVDSNLTVGGTVDGRDVAADGTKLDGIEAGATADQTAGEIKTAYESNSDTNAFTDAEQTKLSGIEASADVTDTANVTAAGALMDSELTDIAAVKALNQGVATTDDPTFTNTQLASISETISDTAVDVFVYDTRKDSDGGAWRKRTQHTSWYNETLNTATRGSRKEFPSVAVIVAETNTVTIYDGDDPDLPMWMVFNGVGGANTSCAMLGGTTDTVSCVSFLNGYLTFGIGNSSVFNGLVEVKFIEDIGYHRPDYAYFHGIIAERNVQKNLITGMDTSYTGLVNSVVNDVAMTVLPNAPIDAATGLPVPTIAVATAGGVSVIKDDGTVVDITGFVESPSDVIFKENGELVSTGEFDQMLKVFDIPASDTTVASYKRRYSYHQAPKIDPPNDSVYATYGIQSHKDTLYRASSKALVAVSENVQSKTSGMVAFTASTYNTGWMNGDIKLATLSDTDDTDVTGSELVTNGTFATDSDWTKGAGWTIGSGVASHNSASGAGDLTQSLTLTVGKAYTIVVEITATDTTELYFAIDAGEYVQISGSPVGTHSHTFIASSTSQNVGVRASGNWDGSIDNISVRLAEEDRSVNGNGLQVFGTVTKNPVATGADLVAYSGFSASNYLKQPENPDIQADGDWCAMFWLDPESTTSNRSYVNYDGNGTNYYGWSISQVNKALRCYTWNSSNPGNNSNNGEWDANFGDREGTWNHVVLCFNNARAEFTGYLNGEKKFTEDEGLAKNTNGFLVFGTSDFLNASSTAKLALFRYSTTVPSPEQIKKIYEDEKHLFTEGSQATLYGSSDAVTALAYDDSTELLHVGTSAGRSVFQGLRRVDNTTTAVGAAISASGGLVADE